MSKKVLFLISVILPQISTAFFCPNNFNQIDFGNTMEQVKQQCGKPDKEETKESTPQVAQEWNYYVQSSTPTQATYQMQGTLKTQMTFDASGKLVNISINGIGVGATNACGSTVRLGDSQASVKAACGDPVLTNKDASAEGQQATKITEWTYQANPPVTLVFEEGVLKERR